MAVARAARVTTDFPRGVADGVIDVGRGGAQANVIIFANDGSIMNPIGRLWIKVVALIEPVTCSAVPFKLIANVRPTRMPANPRAPKAIRVRPVCDSTKEPAVAAKVAAETRQRLRNG